MEYLETFLFLKRNHAEIITFIVINLPYIPTVLFKVEGFPNVVQVVYLH